MFFLIRAHPFNLCASVVSFRLTPLSRRHHQRQVAAWLPRRQGGRARRWGRRARRQGRRGRIDARPLQRERCWTLLVPMLNLQPMGARRQLNDDLAGDIGDTQNAWNNGGFARRPQRAEHAPKRWIGATPCRSACVGRCARHGRRVDHGRLAGGRGAHTGRRAERRP